MKRNSLTTAIVAGIAGIAGFAGLANAVDLNPDGLGQVLVYPYYTVNADQQTILQISGRDVVVGLDFASGPDISAVIERTPGNPVRVRFLEGSNVREVLDFNLYVPDQPRVT
jgi:hypothetical protein